MPVAGRPRPFNRVKSSGTVQNRWKLRIHVGSESQLGELPPSRAQSVVRRSTHTTAQEQRVSTLRVPRAHVDSDLN
jgi:hypothetical protein